MQERHSPKISIIMCFLNVEAYIEEAIKSVLAQHYSNWELVMVDDGSSDLSTQIARHYGNEYPKKIKYLEHAGHINLGASKSRNVGIAKAGGTLITFLDGDDILLPDMLSILLQQKDMHKAEMVMEASKYWYSWNDSIKKDEIIKIGAPANKTYQPPELMYHLYPLGDGAAPCICGLLVDREVLLRHGSFDESFKGMYDDQSLLIKIYLHEKVFVSDGYHNLYRQRPGSLVYSSHSASNYLSERKNFLLWLKRYFQHNQIKDRRLNKMLASSLIPFYPGRFFFQKRLPGKIKSLFRKIAFNR